MAFTGDLTEQEFRVQNLPVELLGSTIRSAQLNIFVLSPCTISYYCNYTAFVFFSVRFEKYFGCPQGYRDNSISAEYMHCDLRETLSRQHLSLYFPNFSLYLPNNKDIYLLGNDISSHKLNMSLKSLSMAKKTQL